MSDAPSSPPPSPSPDPGLDSAIVQMLMDHLPDRIYFKDLQSKFVRNNTAHARSLGRTPAQCVGKTDFDFFAIEHAHVAFDDEQEIIRTGKPIIGKVERATLLDGSYGWMSTTKLPWRDREGRIIGTFGVTRHHGGA